MTESTIATLRGTRIARKCRMCHEPIVLARTVDGQKWLAFEAYASGPKSLAPNGVMVEELNRTDRHFCSRSAVAAA